MANDVLGSVAATRLSLFSLRQALSTYGKEDRNRDAEIPDVAGVLSDLALALAMEGRYGPANLLLQRTLSIDAELFGWNGDGAVGSDLNNSGVLLQHQGRLREAEFMFRRAVKVGEKTLRRNSVNLAVWRTNLARLLSFGEDRNREQEALDLLTSSLTVLETQLGRYHHDTLAVMERMASLYIRRDEFRPAEDLLEDAVARYDESMGADHPLSVPAKHTLREVLGCQGKSWDDRQLLLDGDADLTADDQDDEEALSSTEPALTGLAQMLRKAGRHEDALDLYYRALREIDRPEPLASSHPRLVVALSNYALALVEVGRASEVEPLLQRITDLLEDSYGKEHPMYFRGLSNLASTLDSAGQRARALHMLQECHRLAAEALGPFHPEVAVYAALIEKERSQQEPDCWWSFSTVITRLAGVVTFVLVLATYRRRCRTPPSERLGWMTARSPCGGAEATAAVPSASLPSTLHSSPLTVSPSCCMG